MVKRNPYLNALKTNYLFPEVTLRKQNYLSLNPTAPLISLGIGDTTEHLTPHITETLVHSAERLGTKEGYVGYGPEQGNKVLREKISTRLYKGKISPDDIFISDGAKCDLGRLQALFGSAVSIAVQDPAYPVYIDGSLIHGVTKIISMPCTPENGFFPNLAILPRTDIIYFCSPNNPTSAAASKEQLEQLVTFAKANKSIIVYDSAYAHYIQDDKLPKSIYEIEGAEHVAIEISSFSKIAGFTGVRLGWTIVPEKLKYENEQSVKADWKRITSTIFNGASNIAQWGGCAILEDKGIKEVAGLAAFYMENARILKKALAGQACEVFGGQHAPYLWVRFKGKSSWDIFQQLLENLHLVTTPGLGFGPSGEGFIRIAAFGHRENILRASERLAGNSKN